MKLSREEILRMVGLSSKGLGGRLNEIEEGLEGAGDTLERYWTQIVKNEREITLIAGREAENETNIAQLQVTAREISARVTTVSNEVDEMSGVVTQHTTKIGQLEVSDSQIRASVQTVSDTVTTQGQTIDGLSSTVSTHTTKIGQLEVNDSQIRASVQTVSDDLDTVSGTVSTHTTKIGQLEVSDTQIRSSVSTLTTTVNGHTSKISTLEQTDSTIQASVSSLSSSVDTNTSDIASLKIRANSINLRVEEIEDDYVTSGDLSLYVSKNSVSWLTGSADNVIFNFSNVFQIQHDNQAVLNLDGDGNLKIKGQLEENSTIGTMLPIRVDSSGNIQRKTPDGSWSNLYAARYVRVVSYPSSTTKTLVDTDDFVLSLGSYNKRMRMPANPSYGKVITIINIGGGTTYITPNTGQLIRYGNTEIQPSDYGRDLDNTERAEMVYYEGVWYFNIIGY